MAGVDRYVVVRGGKADETILWGGEGDLTIPDAQLVREAEWSGPRRTPPEEPTAAVRRSVEEKIANSLARLEEADANWATMTANQREAAMRIAIRAAAKLARLALGQLDRD